MKTLINDYGLRFYVRDLYLKNSGKRGGEIFRPFYKKEVKPFQIRIKCAIGWTQKVISSMDEKYPLCKN